MGKRTYLNERGEKRAERFIRRTDLSMVAIGQTFKMGRVTAKNMRMQGEPEVAALSSEDRSALIWHLLESTNQRQQAITAITGLSRTEVARILGHAPSTPRRTRLPVVSDEMQAAWWKRHRVETIQQISETSGVTRQRLQSAIKSHVLQNLTDADGLPTNVSRQFILGRIFDTQPVQANDVLQWLGVTDVVKWQRMVAVIESEARQDHVRCPRWQFNQISLTDAQIDEVRRRTREGQHLPYIRYKLTDVAPHGRITPLIASVMRHELALMDGQDVAELDADLGEDILPLADLMAWKSELLAARAEGGDAQAKKIVALGLKGKKGLRLTFKGHYACAYFSGLKGEAFAMDMFLVGLDTVAISQVHEPGAFKLGRRRGPTSDQAKRLLAAGWNHADIAEELAIDHGLVASLAVTHADDISRFKASFDHAMLPIRPTGP